VQFKTGALCYRIAVLLVLASGVIQADVIQADLGQAGDFPASSLFNARGVIETPFGNFFTGPGPALARSEYCPIAGSITSLPPFGTTYITAGQTPLFSVNDPTGGPVAVIIVLAHRVSGTPISQTAFPAAGIDTFQSVFQNISIRITAGPMAGTILNLPDLVDPAQEVSRSAPFVDGGPGIDDSAILPLPPGSTLPNVVHDSDIDFFEPLNGTSQRSVFLELIALDASSADDRYRILSGRQMQAAYPDLFVPSFGIAVSNVPEPSAVLLFGTGIFLLVGASLRRRIAPRGRG
jgi:hypothetical protein